MEALSRIRVVLVEPTHPGNVGAAARAMRTMGLERLVLVAPREFPSEEAWARASGAEEVLERARVVATLDEALAGCGLAVGTSARRRSLAWPGREPRAAAAEAVAAAAAGTEVAFVFGRERTGLTNAELDRCQALLTIPTVPDFRSLNVAAAVQVVAYELHLAARGAPPAEPPAEPPATADELESFYGHLERVMVRVGFLDPDNPRRLMRRMRRLFARARPERTELNILRGILTAVERCCGGRGPGR